MASVRQTPCKHHESTATALAPCASGDVVEHNHGPKLPTRNRRKLLRKRARHRRAHGREARHIDVFVVAPRAARAIRVYVTMGGGVLHAAHSREAPRVFTCVFRPVVLPRRIFIVVVVVQRLSASPCGRQMCILLHHLPTRRTRLQGNEIDYDSINGYATLRTLVNGKQMVNEQLKRLQNSKPSHRLISEAEITGVLGDEAKGMKAHCIPIRTFD
ncbi:hypothetical protein DFH09DRAFT_1103241 [Mycena vulgaris]|nr:hypothetical protein DFH09DRAFT_1103241 [Mycena vulgaris]